jgi:hypothetical protein
MKVLINPNSHPVYVPNLENITINVCVYPCNFGYVAPPFGVTEIEITSDKVINFYKLCVATGMLAVLDKAEAKAEDIKPLHDPVTNPNDETSIKDTAVEPTTEANPSAEQSIVGTRNVISEEDPEVRQEETTESHKTVPVTGTVQEEKKNEPVVKQDNKRRLVIKRK